MKTAGCLGLLQGIILHSHKRCSHPGTINASQPPNGALLLKRASSWLQILLQHLLMSPEPVTIPLTADLMHPALIQAPHLLRLILSGCRASQGRTVQGRCEDEKERKGSSWGTGRSLSWEKPMPEKLQYAPVSNLSRRIISHHSLCTSHTHTPLPPPGLSSCKAADIQSRKRQEKGADSGAAMLVSLVRKPL